MFPEFPSMVPLQVTQIAVSAHQAELLSDVQGNWSPREDRAKPGSGLKSSEEHTSIYSNPKLVALYISAPTRVAVEGQQRGVVFLSKITPSTGR